MKKKVSKIPRPLKIILLHLFVFAVFAIWLFLTGCPFYKLTGIPCPGCGLSRAFFCAVKLDFATAWYFNPLVFFLPLPILYLIHRKAWRLPGGKRTAIVIVSVLLAVSVAVYLIRAACEGSFVHAAIHSSPIFKK